MDPLSVPVLVIGVIPAPGSPGWSGTTKQTLSYGYGLNATPMQIATAYAALGNGCSTGTSPAK